MNTFKSTTLFLNLYLCFFDKGVMEYWRIQLNFTLISLWQKWNRKWFRDKVLLLYYKTKISKWKHSLNVYFNFCGEFFTKATLFKARGQRLRKVLTKWLDLTGSVNSSFSYLQWTIYLYKWTWIPRRHTQGCTSEKCQCYRSTWVC